MTVTTEQDELRELVRQGAEANERPDLVERMRTADVAGILRALESLEVDLRTRRAALRDPGRGARLTAEARHAEIRLRRFQERAAKWQRTLGEALSEADSNVEYAVQARLRALLDDGTALIGSRGDLEQWLRGRLVNEVEASYQALREAADSTASRMAAALDLPLAALAVKLGFEPAGTLVATIRRQPHPSKGRQPLASRLLGIVMPTYSGMMIALVLPRLFGLTMPLWLILTCAIVGALGMGGSAVAAERQRQASRRDAETIGGLRSTVDAFRMALGKQVRDGVRAIDQQLHAAVGEAVARRTRRMSGAAEALKEAAADSRHIEQGLKDIDADLDSIRELHGRASRLQESLAGADDRSGQESHAGGGARV